MAKLVGGALRTVTTFLYVLAFLCAATGLGIFSYFLSRLAKHDLVIANRWRAVEGLTGSAVLYCIFAILLTCFLGGKRAFAFCGILLDILFCGAMIAVAVLCRKGASSCKGIVNTPLGIGPANGPGDNTSYGADYGVSCKLNTAVFATALIAAFLFLLCAIFQFLLSRHHQKEKKYGPSPANNYTSGSGKKKFWQRQPKTTTDAYGNGNGTELGAAGVGKSSYEHDRFSGTTHGNNDTTNYGNTSKYDNAPNHTHHDAHHTSPGYGAPLAGPNYRQGETAYEAAHSEYGRVEAGPGPTANPYGYSNNANTHPTGTAVNY